MATAGMTLTANATLATQYQSYFSPKLLEHATEALCMDQMGAMDDLPRNAGAKSLTFFRRKKANKAHVGILAEGTPPTVHKAPEFEQIEVPLVQIGEVASLSDVASWTGLFKYLEQIIGKLGEDAALYADGVMRDALMTGITAAKHKRYAQGITSFANLAAAAPAAASIIPTDILDSVTVLRRKRAPRFGGRYLAAVAPEVARDLMNHPDWIDVHKYAGAGNIFRGEIGEWHGVRFLEWTAEFREAKNGAEGTEAADGEIYSTIICGKGAFGVPRLAGDRPTSPQVIIVDKATKSDPLNQFITVGWKAFYAAKVLEDEWGCVIRSQTQHV